MHGSESFKVDLLSYKNRAQCYPRSLHGSDARNYRCNIGATRRTRCPSGSPIRPLHVATVGITHVRRRECPSLTDT